MTRDKRNCMRLGTGLCPRSEVWKQNDEQCPECPEYIARRVYVSHWVDIPVDEGGGER